MDPVAPAVIEDLSSRYCPHDLHLFVLRLAVFVLAFFAVGIVTLVVARKTSTKQLWPFAAGWVLIVFALGAGALDFFGFSGCNGHFTPGLTWDWPW
jgi:hypothetical protein